MVKGLLCKVNGGSDGIREENSRLFGFWFGGMNVGLSRGSDCVVDGDSGAGLRGLDCRGGEVHHEDSKTLRSWNHEFSQRF